MEEETPVVPTAPSSPDIKLSYFIMISDGVKMVAYGDSTTQDGIIEAVPVGLFPKQVPEDIAKDFLTTLTVKDPNGDIGKAIKEAVQEQLAAEKKMMESTEQSGLPPGTEIPEGAIVMSEDEAAAEGPFVV